MPDRRDRGTGDVEPNIASSGLVEEFKVTEGYELREGKCAHMSSSGRGMQTPKGDETEGRISTSSCRTIKQMVGEARI